MTTTAATKANLVNKLNKAYAIRDAHAEFCTEWDYESGGGCLECEQNRRMVRDLLRKVRSAS